MKTTKVNRATEQIAVPTNAKQLAALVKQGEGTALEFKRSTGELKEGMQTLCAFLNGSGGTVLFGVRPDGIIEGQDVSDRTLRDIAQTTDRFEPPAHVTIQRIKVKAGRDVVVVSVDSGQDSRPFVYESHAYERVSSTTRRMVQAKYERLLLERGHSKRRWENLPAEGRALKDLDRFPVPLDALREIMLNAVMHRDYSHYSGYVAIVVFDDRIEIRSYGHLPNGVTVKQLSGKHDSKPTNPLIAGTFHRTGAVEVWGRGTNRVIAMCKKHGAPAPVFEDRQGFLIVTFKTPQVEVAAHPGVQKTVEKTVEMTVEKTVEKLLQLLRSKPRITQMEIASETGLSRRGVEWNLKEMKKKGQIKRIGSDKGGHWEVVG